MPPVSPDSRNNHQTKRYRLGFDIGGTFTDFALHDTGTGALHVWKGLSTPSDPAQGALAGIDELLEMLGISIEEVDQVVHGTTIGANTVIERKGEPSALLVTDGFRDLLIIQRPLRYSTYDLWFNKHAPLVPRSRVFAVPERVAYDGEVVRSLDEDAVRAIADELAAEGIRSVAVSFLHAYANPAHERRVGEILNEALPAGSVSLSHEVAPIIGEYERTSTTVVNAYIKPAFSSYLGRLTDELRERGFVGRVFINQGNGGLTTPTEIERFPVRALESGPAAGVAMAAWLGSTVGRSELVAFDMGGTTAKACLVEDGRPRMERSFDVDQTLMRTGTGLPVATPTVDLIEIGAGGGSIAHVELGIIEVGPESAGADPGPVCYARGGERTTVTDANVVLGYLNPDFFLGGRMHLDVAEARAAIETQIARSLGLDAAEAAWGIHEAVTSNMEHAIRSISTERGRDPRELTLVAFGGAGPSHAARLARNLAIRSVVFPAAAGIASAVGLLQAEPRFDVERTFVTRLDGDLEALWHAIDELDASVVDMLGRVSPGSRPELTRLADMQYVGQGHVIEIELPANGAGFAAQVEERFKQRYASLYGYSYEDAVPQIVAVKVSGQVAAVPFELPANDAAIAPDAPVRAIYFPEAGGYVETPTYKRDELPNGFEVSGPAVIEDGQCAALLLPGDRATVDERRNLIAEIGAGAGPPAGGQRLASVPVEAS